MAMRMRTGTSAHPTRAAIYCRVSSAGQEDNSSLGTQEAACRAYAAERGWVVVEVYRDVHTGAELFERPQLGRLRETTRAGTVDVVLAHALDRVSRSQAHLGFLLSEWDHLGARLELVTEELAETPEGRLLQSVRGFVAEMERLKIAERTQRGIRARVAAGKPLAGWKAPYGYQWADPDKTRLVVDPETAPVVRRIVSQMAGGTSLRGIASGLAADGIPSPTGRHHWSVSTITELVANPTYVGERRAFRERVDKVRGRGWVVSPRPDLEQVILPAGIAPPLISRDEQAVALARLARNKGESSRRNKDPEATLLRAGFARCGYCGCAMRVNHRRHGPVYLCNDPYGRRGCPKHTVAAHLLDGTAWDRVETVLRSPEIIAAEVERLRASGSPAGDDLTAVDVRLTAIEARRQRVARAVVALEDEEAAEPLLAELGALATQKRVLDAERMSLATVQAGWEADQKRLGDLKAWCERVAGNLQVLGYADKRDALTALGVEVHVWRADHTPRWQITMQIDDIVSATAGAGGRRRRGRRGGPCTPRRRRRASRRRRSPARRRSWRRPAQRRSAGRRGRPRRGWAGRRGGRGR